MTAAATTDAPVRRTPGFALPSAYTILFVLIVIVALADVDHPGRRLRHSTRTASRSRARTTRSSRTRSGSSSTR